MSKIIEVKLSRLKEIVEFAELHINYPDYLRTVKLTDNIFLRIINEEIEEAE